MYYCYRELYDAHLFKDERKVLERTDHHVFTAVATFMDDMYDPSSLGQEQDNFLMGLLDVMEAIISAYEAWADSVENVIKQGAMKADNSRNRLLFVKRLQSLITLNALNLKWDREIKDFKAGFKPELDDLLKETKTMAGMKRLLASYVAEVDEAYERWYGSPIIDLAQIEMFPKSSNNETSQAKPSASKAKASGSKAKASGAEAKASGSKGKGSDPKGKGGSDSKGNPSNPKKPDGPNWPKIF